MQFQVSIDPSALKARTLREIKRLAFNTAQAINETLLRVQEAERVNLERTFTLCVEGVRGRGNTRPAWSQHPPRDNALQRAAEGTVELPRGFDTRSLGHRPAYADKPCAHCRTPFATNNEQQKYCSDKCRFNRWKKERISCSFCGRLNLVERERGGDQAVRCCCGARYFRRRRRTLIGRDRKRRRRFLYVEERGWKKRSPAAR